MKTFKIKDPKIQPWGAPDSMVYEWEVKTQKLEMRIACG